MTFLRRGSERPGAARRPQAQLDGYLEEDPACSNIAMVDVAVLIQRHSV
ncbi:hypothetical protein ACFQVD_08250 [Streptosporangium amethystogenes subsp. fukuiense]|uniref:Uncharacterized protein n=1 Tax=Streptosporangium amethystogenes subsp. fukuiense TaxID=698418 RepID=A0ABW2SVG1_9ACTN